MCETCKGTNFDSLDHLKEHVRQAHCGSQFVYVLTCGHCELVLAEATTTKNITRSSHLMRQHLYWATQLTILRCNNVVTTFHFRYDNVVIGRSDNENLYGTGYVVTTL